MSPALERFFAWPPLVMLGVMFVAGRVRAAVMRRRGVRVVIVDLQRPVKEQLYDVLVIAVVIVWVYLLVAEASASALKKAPGNSPGAKYKFATG